MSLYAVIDLGTNTFHILIVKRTDNFFEEVYRRRVFVNIAEEGIDRIGKAPFQRGLDTLVLFNEKLKELEVSEVVIIGTAALRTAENGIDFQNKVKTTTGLQIQIIDGKREATLIAKGTKAIVNMKLGKFLIMDIGGGSIEFILFDNNEIKYAESFPIGVTKMYNQFKHQEPISEKNKLEIAEHISEILKPLLTQIKNLKVDGLIGASGSFEVLESMINEKISRDQASYFDFKTINALIDSTLRKNLEERLSTPGIPKHRAKLISIAFFLMSFIIEKADFKELIVSPYALKEGVLAEMMNI